MVDKAVAPLVFLRSHLSWDEKRNRGKNVLIVHARKYLVKKLPQDILRI
jgi:hypothetical protein